MPKKGGTALVRQGRELVKQSKQLCDVSRECIERGKGLRENGGRRASKANGARRRVAQREMNVEPRLVNAR